MSTTTQTPITTMTEAFEAAMAHMERVGHHRGSAPYNPKQTRMGTAREECACSVDAALRIVVYGTYIPSVTVTSEQYGLVLDAERAIQKHTGQRISEWSDGHTKRQIFAVLRKLARAQQTLEVLS